MNDYCRPRFSLRCQRRRTMKVRLTMSPRVRAEMYRRGHEPMPRSWLGSNKYTYDLTNIQEAIQRAWAAGYRAGKRRQSTVSGQQK